MMDTLMNDKSFKELMIADGGALIENFMSIVKNRI